MNILEFHRNEKKEVPISKTISLPELSENQGKLKKSFYRRNCLTVAKELLGKLLVMKNKNFKLCGVITETEAYPGINDEASHSYKGITKRNEQMFEAGGVAYVYFTYGNHFCFNVVTGKKDIGSAVLIRSLQPLTGIKTMMKNRNTDNIFKLTTGPGKITQAFGINRRHNGEDLTGNNICIMKSDYDKGIKIVRCKRIGINKNPDKLYRFIIAGNKFISVKCK